MILRLRTAHPKIEGALAQALSRGDEDTVVDALRNLPVGVAGQDRDLLSSDVFDILQETTSHRIRNAAALALVDLGVGQTTMRIVDVLRRPGLSKASGTLLFALNEIDASIPLSVIMDTVENGSFEARNQAIIFLEDRRFDVFGLPYIQAVLGRLTDLMSSDDQETVDVADYARECLSDYARQHDTSREPRS